MRALRESASRGERQEARHMRQENGQHDKVGDAPVEEQAVGPACSQGAHNPRGTGQRSPCAAQRLEATRPSWWRTSDFEA